MIENLYFLNEDCIKITAASVGISKERWVSIKNSEVALNNHIEIMSKYKFDHLPIDNGQNTTEYFKTKIPNDYSKIERFEIKFDDLIPVNMPIETVIEKFSRDRTFFFLSYNNNISGLITIGNLNCKQVQVFLFSKVCEVERELAYFLNHQLSNNEILEWLNVKKSSKFDSIIKSYEDLVSLDLENQLTEHFFLVDFFIIITDKKLYELLKFTKKEWKELSSINELRNCIAHPTRSLIDEKNTIDKFKERLIKMNNLLFKLNNFKRNCIPR